MRSVAGAGGSFAGPDPSLWQGNPLVLAVNELDNAIHV
jgi:hypothetical protein